MPNYLTPARYRTMGAGISLTGRSDAELSSHIATASALVNSYCCVPDGHDFRGGTVVDEPHIWDVGNVKRAGSNRVWPFHRPIKAVSSVHITVTNNQSINFDNPDSLYVNASEGWIEPVDLALTTFGVFGYGILPNIGLRQPVALVSYTYGRELAVDDTVVPASGALTIDLTSQFLTDDEVVVRKNGSPLLGATVNRTEGQVTLPLAANGTDIYRVTATTSLPMAIARATALIATDLIGLSAIASSGLTGLSGIKVKEVELRQSKASFAGQGMSAPVRMLLDPYVVRSMA